MSYRQIDAAKVPAVLAALKAGRTRIEDIKHWGQRYNVQTTAAGETRYCALGAIPDTAPYATRGVLTDASHVLYGKDVVRVNDRRGKRAEVHAKVLLVYDDAIAYVEGLVT